MNLFLVVLWIVTGNKSKKWGNSLKDCSYSEVVRKTHMSNPRTSQEADDRRNTSILTFSLLQQNVAETQTKEG